MGKNGILAHGRIHWKRKFTEPVFRGYRRRKTNVARSWIDNHRAFDVIPHSWIMESMNVFRNCVDY